jgi:hypothetical protein
MKLDDNLEEIFRLAFQASPSEAEYYATKVLFSMPRDYVIPGRQGRNEYELDEPDEIRHNYERVELENLISKLRTSLSK